MDESIPLDDVNGLRKIKEGNNVISNEGPNSTNNLSNFISSLHLKENKSSSRRSCKKYSIMSRDISKTGSHSSWMTFLSTKTITKINQNYGGSFILILFGCFCFGITLASKECQGIKSIKTLLYFNNPFMGLHVMICKL